MEIFWLGYYPEKSAGCFTATSGEKLIYLGFNLNS